MSLQRLFHPSSRPTGRGITIGTPRLYDWSAGLFFLGTRRRAYRALIEAAGVQKGDQVLDVGSGPGYLAKLLAETVGPDGSVVGVDAAPEMVEYAAGSAKDFANCSFQAGSAEQLEFADGRFDVVVSSLVMHHLPDESRLAAVAEMSRVLRPGGRLLLADFSVPQRGVWHVVGALTNHSSGQMASRVSALEPLVQQAGFVDLRSGDTPPWFHYVRATKRKAGDSGQGD